MATNGLGRGAFGAGAAWSFVASAIAMRTIAPLGWHGHAGFGAGTVLRAAPVRSPPAARAVTVIPPAVIAWLRLLIVAPWEAAGMRVTGEGDQAKPWAVRLAGG